MKSIRGYTAFGATLGAAWWLIKDALCVPHGQDTYPRQLLASSLMGGVLFATVLHPVNFVYGCVAGAFYGNFLLEISQPSLPRNFELRTKSTDQAKRARLLREDEEYELSQRNVLTTKGNFYPL